MSEAVLSQTFGDSKQCLSKCRYFSFDAALDDCHRLVKKTGKPFTVYRCPHCGNLHIGSVWI